MEIGQLSRKKKKKIINRNKMIVICNNKKKIQLIIKADLNQKKIIGS